MANTRAHQNRLIRQEALREQLSQQCRVQHVLDTIEEITELDPSEDGASIKLQALKAANDQRLKLLNKYIPDLKAVDLNHSGEVKTNAVSLSDAILAHIAAGSSEGAVDEAGGEEKPTKVH